jgi:WD40 repeat protein
MDILQAYQEIQRLRGLYAAGQISPEAFAQAVNQMQITDAAGSFWHLDGATLKWYRYEGQTWVERLPPLPPPPPYPVQSAGPAWTAPYAPVPAPRPSRLPLWIGLGVIGLLVIAAAVIFGGELLAPAPTPTPTPTSAALPTIGVSAVTPLVKTTVAVISPAPTRTVRPTQRLVFPTSAPTATPAAPSVDDYLNPDGPWLLSKDYENVFWISPDGIETLNAEKVVAPYEVAAMISPSGGNVAFITSPSADGMHQLMLTIYNLPVGGVITEIALTSLKTEPGPEMGPGDPSFEALRSITDFTSIAWSPDGRQLAFIGFMDGPSSDLYLYTLDTGKVTRLTDGPSQAFEPTWSPDGKVIVQFGASAFGTGAGFSMAGVWATRPDTGVSIELYKPSSSGEVGLGWAGPNTYLVYSFSPACGTYNLRAVDIQPVKVRTIFSGCFNSVDFDRAAGSLVLGIAQDTADFCTCGEKVDSGLYLLKLDGSYQRLDPANYFQVSWIKGANVAWGMTDTDQVLAFNKEGNVIGMPEGVPVVLPLAAPGGTVWAWSVDTNGVKPGLWIGPPGGAKATKFINLPVSSALWNKTGTALIFLSGGQLYAAAAPQYEPLPLVELSSPGRLAWVTP